VLPDLSFVVEEFAARAQQAARNAEVQELMIGGATGAVVVASVAYALWSVRAGVLLVQAATALPSWAQFDPLPVLEFDAKARSDRGQDRSCEDATERALEAMLHS
jgi:hypothetical protein